jgi:pyrimidine-nucleoside phosphorylase
MNPLEIITRKRDRQKLSREQIFFLVDNFTAGKIPEYQFSAFLMAAILNGLDTDETFHLTEAMLYSGKSVVFKKTDHPVYDKHSTGGVGDKISLTLSPLLVSLGINIAMLSGRGLGHTGGTLDKLESIPGLNPFWSEAQIKSRLGKTGLAISGQTDKIAPADKKIYALRDLTATVESIPLITASILSKKLALKTDGIIFDIKVGSGAFMKTRRQATQLARSLLGVCQKFKRPAGCLLTDMSQPLGHNIGNYLEIMETVEFLKTGGPDDIRQVTFRLAYEIMRFQKPGIDRKKTYQQFSEAIESGRALSKFREFVKISGGKTGPLDNPKRYFKPQVSAIIRSEKKGFLHQFNTELIGKAALELGAGRRHIDDKTDPMAGIVIYKKLGQKIGKGEIIFRLYTSNKSVIGPVRKMLGDSVKIGKEKIASPKKIITLITR